MAENSVKIKIDGDDSGLQSKLGGIGEKAKASLADVKAGFDMASQAAQKLADASVKVYAGFDDAMRQVQATMNASAQHRVFQSQLLPVWGTTCPSDKKSKKNLISIVAPCAGSDEIAQTYQTVIGAISIHAPRAGSDSNIAQISDDWAAILRHGFQTGPSADCGRIVINQQKTFFIAVSGARTSRAFYVYRRFASGGRSEDQCIGHIN